MANRVAGKIAIVTGAGRGVGREDVKLLVAEGAKVIMTDINADAGQAAADELGDSVEFFQQDVSDAAQWQALIEHVEKQHGGLDILVNNAAILEVGTMESQTLDGWDRLMSINARSVFLGCQTALPLLEKSGGGAIVNMSSVAAIFGMHDFVAYGAAKAAVRSITKTTAVYCHRKKNNVRCNSIHPDGIATDMPMEIAADVSPLSEENAMMAISYTCMPEDIAKTVLFLASDDSIALNGAEIVTDKSSTITPPYG